MKIYLADLYHEQVRGHSATPTNVGFIAEYCKSRFGNKVSVKLFKSADKLLEVSQKTPPDVLGVANYMWSERLNYHCVEQLKKINPEMLAVAGGPNVATDDEGVKTFLETYPLIDKYILFGAEVPFADLIQVIIEKGRSAAKSEIVRGVHHLVGSDVVGSAFINPEKNLDFIPSPFLSGAMDEFIEDGHVPIFETNRGCPFSCTFCVWGIAALGKLKSFSMKRVEAEMEYVARKFPNTKQWILADANFGIMPRDVDIARLLRKLYDEYNAFQSVNIWWSKTITNRSFEIAKILGKLTQAYVAFQSLDPMVLENIKRSNISVDKLNEFKNEVEAYTNGSYTDILLGLPGETKKSHMESYFGALKLGFDQVGGGEVRLLPGSEMGETSSRQKYGIKSKYRISEGDVSIFSGKPVYELEEVIRQTDAISEEEMIELRTIRAFLYFCITIGETEPINKYLIESGVNILTAIDTLIKNTDPLSELGMLINEFNTRSENEWFDSPSHANQFFSDDQNKQSFFRDPPPKLNFWLTSKLYSSPAAYNQFFMSLVKTLTASKNIDTKTLNQLCQIAKRRNYLLALMGENLEPSTAHFEVEKLNPEVTKYLDIKNPRDNPDGNLQLYIEEKQARFIRDAFEELNTSNDYEFCDFLQRFRYKYFMSLAYGETSNPSFALAL